MSDKPPKVRIKARAEKDRRIAKKLERYINQWGDQALTRIERAALNEMLYGPDRRRWPQ